MLVLTRKTGEQIVVGDVTITVVRVDQNQVRIGIDAPKTTPIYRAELTPADRESLATSGRIAGKN